MLSTLLLTATTFDFWDLFIKWLPSALLAIGLYLYKRNYDEAKEKLAKDKKEIEEICDRLEIVEDKQSVGYPKFKELIEDVKEVKDRVNIHQEQRFTGISGQIERITDLYDLRLQTSDKRVSDLEKRLDKIDDKLDRILSEVMKNK